ncbi:MAG: DUF4364 family protein [Saccharolobus sp.]
MAYKTRKRSPMEIIYSMLSSCNNECGITKMIYGAAVNYVVAQKYINELIKIGALKVENKEDKKYYIVTEKGKLLMQHLEEFLKLRQSLDNTLDKVKEFLYVEEK